MVPRVLEAPVSTIAASAQFQEDVHMSKSLAAVIAAISLTAAGCGLGSSDEAGQTAAGGTETTLASAAPETGAVESDSADQAADGSADQAADGSGDETAAPASDDQSSDSGNSAGGGTIGIGGARVTLGDTILAGTLNPAADTSTARFNAVIDIVGAPDSDLPGELTLAFDGAYDIGANSSDITIDFGDVFAAAAATEADSEFGLFADFFEEPIRIVTIEDTSYVQWGLLGILAGGDIEGDVWLETPADESEDLAASFGPGIGGGESPAAFLDQLRDADATVEDLGSEEIRGTQTTHYRALVDTETLTKGMDAEERAEFESTFGGADTAFPMDFWVGDDGLLYRYVISIDASALPDSDGLEQLSITYEIFDYGQDVMIVPPPADQIISDDALGGLGFGN